jgi:hypothetical protein
MRHQLRLLPAVFLLGSSLLVLNPVGTQGQVQPRVVEAVDNAKRVTLAGNVHPLARAEFDQGAAADALPMTRMLLLLKRSDEQEAALQDYLEKQQDKSSANYHQWLTPQEFGAQYGPADADVQAVTGWLGQQGFQVNQVYSGKTVIEFSGTAGQVRTAFVTAIHNYLVEGKTYTANASDPQIPVALAPVVAGIVSLNSFPMKSYLHRLGTFQRSRATGKVTPLFTFSGCQSGTCFAVGPPDFATVYNTAPLLSGSPKIDGTGQTIAIVGESNINVQDVVDFRTIFGLAQNFTASNVILNGTDPGINGSEGESDLDIEWSGAVAPGATIDFVTSAPTETTSGIQLSALYIVDNNLAGVMSESFGGCEQNLGSALNQFYSSLWEQAAAQGITVMLAAGDGGSAGCDDFDTATVATKGLAVSGLASTPFNIAVGGTDFDQLNNWSQYWNTTPTPTTPPVPASALKYIPEVPWNDSCAQNGLNACTSGNLLDIVAGSGGVSTIYAKPPWQMGVTGVPNDNRRDLPDVSLFASNGFNDSFYIVCQRDADIAGPTSCGLNSIDITFQGVGGTSASTPAFAGIMALVNQNQATPQNPAPRQGNANYVLYALAKKQVSANLNCNSSLGPVSGCTFNDVTKSNNAVPCAGKSPNCSSSVSGVNGVLVEVSSPTTPAYPATAGYDMATGLGSVNAQNLVNNWNTVNETATTTALSLNNNNAVNIAHGASVPVAVTVVPSSAKGDVSLIADLGNGKTLGFDTLTLGTNGTVSGTTAALPGGTSYSVHAHYTGDGTNAPSDSSTVNVTVTPGTSKVLISIPVFDPITGKETGNTPASLIYGTPYMARIDVGNGNAVLTFPSQPVCNPPSCPTGNITWTDSLNGGTPTPLDGGTFPLNSAGFTEDLPIQLPGGNHILSAAYSGDPSYNSSVGTYSLTVAPAATTMVAGNPPLSPQITTPFGFNTILTTQSSGVMPSCNVAVFDGTTQLTGPVQCEGFAGGATWGASLQPIVNINQATAGTHTYSVKFTGDANYAPSNTFTMTTRVFEGTTTTLTADSTTVQYGTSITLTAVVDSTGPPGPPMSQAVQFTFNNNSVAGTVTYTPFTDSSGNAALRATFTTVPQSSGFYSANFSGDSTYGQSGALINVTVNIPDFSVTANLSSPSITAGNSATATITVTPAGSSSSPVVLACQPNGMPMGISCAFSPGTVNLSGGNPATSTLTISTLAPSSSTSTSSVPLQPFFPYSWPRFFWPLPMASLLAVFFLFLLPARLRRNRFVAVSALACGLSLLIGLFGCGGGSSGGGGGGGGGLVPTSITLTTSSVKVASNPASGGSVNLTANVTSSKTPGGTVIFVIDGSNGFSVSSPVLGGVAQFQLTSLSVGVHTITAQYSGDANTLSSQTKGSLNVAVTGPTGIGLQANTGGLFHTIGINFNLQ